MKNQSRGLIAALLAVLTVLAVTFALTTDSPGPASAPSVTAVELGGPGNHELVVGPATRDAIAQAKTSDVDDHQGERSEQPDGVSRADLDAGREQQEQLAATDQLPVVSPLAAPQQTGCRTSLVQNYSSRRGVRPRLFVLHYTVSPNRPGWADVNAIVSIFDRPSFAASSNYIVDAEGHCAYIVRESDKAWTQAAANPVSISVEIINSGKEGRLVDRAGLDKLARIIVDSSRRWDFPLRAGAVNGCTVTRAGIVDHGTLGQCGGGHVDVSPYAVAPVIAAARALAAREAKPKVSDKARDACTRLNFHRRRAHIVGRWTHPRVTRARALKQVLDQERAACPLPAKYRIAKRARG